MLGWGGNGGFILRRCESNRTVTRLSTHLHRHVKSPDSVLDKSGRRGPRNALGRVCENARGHHEIRGQPPASARRTAPKGGTPAPWDGGVWPLIPLRAALCSRPWRQSGT